jgi:hypothetical protein
MKQTLIVLFAMLALVSNSVNSHAQAVDACDVTFPADFFKPSSVALQQIENVCRYSIVYESANDVPNQLVNLGGKHFASVSEAVAAILQGVPFTSSIDLTKSTVRVRRSGPLGNTGTTKIEPTPSPSRPTRIVPPAVVVADTPIETDWSNLPTREINRLNEERYRQYYSGSRSRYSYSSYRGGYDGYVDPMYAAEWALRLKGAATHGYLKLYAVDDSNFAQHLIVKRLDESGVWRVVGAGGKTYRFFHDAMELPIGKQRLRFEERRGGRTLRFEEDFEIDSKFDREHPLLYPISSDMLQSIEGSLSTIKERQ